MRIKYVSKKFDPAQSYRRFVRMDIDGMFHFCEQDSATGYDMRQGTVDPDELPAQVREAAVARCTFFPSYVEWPFT